MQQISPTKYWVLCTSCLLQLDYKPTQEEAMIIEDMPAMVQFVYDMYNVKLEQLVKANKAVSPHWLNHR